MRIVVVRLVADAIVVAAILFLAAGTVAWSRGWVFVSVLLAMRLGVATVVGRVHPSLMRERATVLVHRDQRWTDRIILWSATTSAYLALPAFAAVDVFRWHLLPPPPLVVAGAGLVMFAFGWVMQGLALRENAFAVTTVRLQSERGHALVDTGVYSVVRHPMYAGSPLLLVGLSLWLGSYTAVIMAMIPLGLLALRIVLEERLLRRELPGYAAYTKRVRYRLIPGVW